jgi:hypothetical protein
VGLRGAGGRPVELRQGERRAQLEAAGALLLRDGDGGQESVLRRRGIGGVAHEQDFAARPMQFCVKIAMPDAIGGRERFV